MQPELPRIFALRVFASLKNRVTGRFLPNTPAHEDNRRWYLSLDGGVTWEKSFPVAHGRPLPVRFNKDDPSLSDHLQFEVYYQDDTAIETVDGSIIVTCGRISNSTLDLASPFKSHGGIRTILGVDQIPGKTQTGTGFVLGPFPVDITGSVAVLKPNEKPRFEFTVAASFTISTANPPDTIVQFAIDPEMDVEIYPSALCD